MITFKQENIFNIDAEAIVNTVKKPEYIKLAYEQLQLFKDILYSQASA